MVYRGKDKPLVQINLADDQEQAFVPTYTSLEQIRGTVSLTAPVDTKIGQIHIGFEGICKTYVEKVATSSPTHGRTEAFHTFLRLGQPIQEAEYPPDHIAKAGETYTFPFIFVVPEQLLPQVCGGHETDNVVHEAHKMPPPTLGDPMTSVWGKSMMDDMAPDMAKISYSIRTRVSGGRESNGKHIIIGDAVRKIRFIPAIAEHPPLMALEGKDGDYRLRQEKKIKKGTLKGKLGTLAMESVQPQSLRLHPPSNKRGCAISTTATINLRFDPATADAEPPRLGSLVTKLKVGTFFSSKALMQIPRRSSEFLYSNTQGLYVDSLQLSSRCVKAVQWIKQTAPDSLPRRESGGSTISNPSLTFVDPSSTYQDKGPYYIARIFVPITLPEKADGNNSNKLFVPTFHSCLVSRVYVLHFYLSCHTPGASIMDPTIHIKIPIQVSAEPNPDAGPTISEDEAQAIARREPAEAPGPLPPRPTYAEAIGSVPPSPSSPGFGQGWWEGAGEPAGRSTESLGLPEGLPDYAVHTAGRLTVSSTATRSS
ncbi:MAG: hypothetical protein LQ352_003265 [Teloschistes flavicans]|nr:MAG: hypothetical protein LQ352_003265 [Teloschistes flavicans]